MLFVAWNIILIMMDHPMRFKSEALFKIIQSMLFPLLMITSLLWYVYYLPYCVSISAPFKRTFMTLLTHLEAGRDWQITVIPTKLKYLGIVAGLYHKFSAHFPCYFTSPKFSAWQLTNFVKLCLGFQWIMKPPKQPSAGFCGWFSSYCSLEQYLVEITLVCRCAHVDVCYVKVDVFWY